MSRSGVRELIGDGWVVLAWVIYWGVCYGNMAVRARGQRVLFWFSAE